MQGLMFSDVFVSGTAVDECVNFLMAEERPVARADRPSGEGDQGFDVGCRSLSDLRGRWHNVTNLWLSRSATSSQSSVFDCWAPSFTCHKNHEVLLVFICNACK